MPNIYSLGTPNTVVTTEQTTKSQGRDLEEFLMLLEANLPKVPTLVRYVTDSHATPSMVFTAGKISECANALENSYDLTSDCLTLLDIIHLYSYNFFGKSSVFMDLISGIITSNRTGFNGRSPVYKGGVEEFFFDDHAKLRSFLDENPLLVVIYTVSLIRLIFTQE